MVVVVVEAEKESTVLFVNHTSTRGRVRCSKFESVVAQHRSRTIITANWHRGNIRAAYKRAPAVLPLAASQASLALERKGVPSVLILSESLLDIE